MDSRKLTYKIFLWHTTLFISSLFLPHFAFASEKLPVEHFASLPDVSQVKLSPDGKHIASLVRIETPEKIGTALSIFNLETGKQTLPVFTDNEEFVFNWINWANNEKILISTFFPYIRYGTRTMETRLLVADIETGSFKNAIPKSGSKNFYHNPQMQDIVVHMMPDDNEHFLLALNGVDRREPKVYKISLNKDKMEPISEGRAWTSWWTVDQQYKVRMAIYFNNKEEVPRYKVRHRFPDTKKWSVLWEFESFSKDQVWPMGFDKDPNILYVKALYNDKDAVFKVNLKDPELKKELVLHNEHYDIDGELIYSYESGEAVGVSTNGERGFTFWHDDYKSLQAGINKALPHTKNYLYSLSHDEMQYIVLSVSDTEPGTFYLGNRNDKSLEPIAYRYKNLYPEQMAEKKKITYKARDGLNIEAYVTLPNTREEGRALPTIIFPHGGPISYDDDGFDYWTQFFANRGYAVMQMNFRGSSGYGHDFMTAGLGNWGLQMQDDVTDGTKWMIEQGYTDPQKVCIVGASYGGYAALMGTVKEPEMYKCAVSFAGVTDLPLLRKDSRRFVSYKIARQQLGSDFGDLKKRSPVKNTDKISTPILLIHGTKDTRVKIEHSRRMRDALKKAKKDVTYVQLEEGTHFLTNNEHRIATFKAMDNFLRKHLN